MTPLQLLVLARELRAELQEARVSPAVQSASNALHLPLQRPGRGVVWLTFRAAVGRPLAYLSGRKARALPEPPNFCRSLRKHLEGARWVDASLEPGERLLFLSFRAAEGTFRLVFEALPKYPNLILVDGNGAIVSALNYKAGVERPVLPREPYAPPPAPKDRPALWQTPGEALRRAWEEAGRPPLPAFLKERFHGMDSEVAARLQEEADFAAAWDRLRSSLREGDAPPPYYLRLDPPAVFVLEPPPGAALPAFDTLSAALEELDRRSEEERVFREERRELEGDLRREVKRLQRLQEKLREDRREAERAEEYRFRGELLMASLHDLPPHLSRADLPDVVRGTGKTVSIPLDPGLSPLQNAQRYFQKSRKGARGLALVERREEEVQRRLEELRSAERSLPALLTREELREARRRLFPAAKVEKVPEAAKARERVPTPGVERRRLGEAFELCAGCSAAANEHVTFQLAGPEDLWFHVRGFSGAHVVLRRLRRGVEFPEDVVREAAAEAARRSKAPPGKVTVSYTKRKHVKRIPGAALGMVNYSGERSVVVEKA